MSNHKKSRDTLTILVLNNCLRTDDSKMMNYYRQMQQTNLVLPVLVADTNNHHKREFDLQQGQMLQGQLAHPIQFLESPKEFARGMAQIVQQQTTIQILIQDTHFNRQILESLLKRVNASKIELVNEKHFSTLEEKNSALAIGNKSVIVYLFEDFLCSKRHEYQFSNTYGYFKKRVILRDLYSKQIERGRVRGSVTSFAELLGCTAISKVKADSKIRYPSQSEVWNSFKNHIYNYAESRDRLGSLFEFNTSTSSFQSPFLSSGVISTAQLLDAVNISSPGCKIKGIVKKVAEKQENPETGKSYSMKELKNSIVKYIEEVLWAEFCHLYWIYNKEALMLNGQLRIGGLYNRKRKWRTNHKLLHDFEFGRLDPQFDLINAAMNQLRIQGFMSNRLRMIVASFCMQQFLDWRECMKIFEKYLVDINFSSNLFGWVFSYNLVAGQPHTFNIERQTKKIDKDGSYRKKWIK